MINILLYELQKNQKISLETKIALSVEKLLLSSENITLSELKNIINEIVLINNQTNNYINTESKINLPIINIYNILSMIAWYCTSEIELERKYNEIIFYFNISNYNEESLLNTLYIIYYLKKNMSINYINQFIETHKLNDDVKISYNLLLNNKNYINSDKEEINILLNIFTFAYYKYIPNELEKYVFQNINNHYLLEIIIDFSKIINYASVICENVSKDTKYIGVKYKYKNEDFIDFYHSKDIKILSNYLLFEDIFNHFYLAIDDQLSEYFIKTKNIDNFFETQKNYFAGKKDNFFDQIKKLSIGFITTNKIEDFKKCITKYNEILEEIQSKYEYIYFDSPSEVIIYIQNKYNTEIKVDNNLKNFYSKI